MSIAGLLTDDTDPITAECVASARALQRTVTTLRWLSAGLVVGVVAVRVVTVLLEKQAQTEAVAACVEAETAAASPQLRRGKPTTVDAHLGVDEAVVHRGADDFVIVTDDVFVLLQSGVVTATATRDRR